MRLLLMNTCGAEGVLALAEDASMVAVELLPGRGSSEALLPALRRLMEGRGWTARDLAAVVVVIGPGSFTGARVGLSAAKGLCEAGAVKMVALSRLGLVADAARTAGEVVALLDAGRAEYYCGVYDGERCFREELVRTDEAQRLVESMSAVTCEARVAEGAIGGVKLVPEPGAESMLAAALRRIARGEWSDVATVDANYLRRTDAELLAKGGA